MTIAERKKEDFASLADAGVISPTQLQEAAEAAASRNIELEWVLRHEYHIPRRTLLQALADNIGCHWVEYDERLPVPPELLTGLDAEMLCTSQWFPIIKDGDMVIIAAASPSDSRVHEEVRTFLPAGKHEFRVALGEDIRNFIQDFLNSPPNHIIGNERTGLAYWRNTMARWRTKLACYRTDFAKARTYLSLLRGGLGFVTIGRAMLHLPRFSSLIPLCWLMIVSGLGVTLAGIITYFRTKNPVTRPPANQTLVEVTNATLYFLEGYQFADASAQYNEKKRTMLSRLHDSIPNFCVFIEPSKDNKVRSSLAHERTSLAGQRTVASCYRTIYSQARTGLSFIRTGVAFISVGLGLMQYFGFSVLTTVDAVLVIAGLFLIVDGGIWYWPARLEQLAAEQSTPKE